MTFKGRGALFIRLPPFQARVCVFPHTTVVYNLIKAPKPPVSIRAPIPLPHTIAES